MRSSLYLILQLVINQFNDIENSGARLLRDDKLICKDKERNWNLQFQHIKAKSNEFDTTVKVSKFVLDIEDAIKIVNKTCWIFECCGYGRRYAWGEKEFSNM